MVNLIRPNTLNEALNLIAEKKWILYSGGTDLMIRYRARAGTLPDFKGDVLYLADLEELKAIKVDEHILEIGSEVTLTEILAHPEIPEYIKAPFAQIGSVAIRNKATLGGNIVNASPAGDSLGMLTALDAQIICQSKQRGENRVPIEAFITGPKTTQLKTDEIVTGIKIPLPQVTCYNFTKVGARSANAISKLSFYAFACYHDGRLDDIHIAFGAMGPTIIRHRPSEMKLIDTKPSQRSEIAIQLYESLLNPIDDLRSTKKYRKQVALNVLSDFIEKELNR